MDQSQKSAAAIVEWLGNQRRVTRIHYPGLPGHPGYAIHHSQSEGAGAVFSFELDSLETTRRLLEESRLSAFAVSLGGVESIISYPARMSHAAMPPEERRHRGITDTLVRLSVGLEDPAALITEMDGILNRE
jgi:cystathionine beta-lyase